MQLSEFVHAMQIFLKYSEVCPTCCRGMMVIRVDPEVVEREDIEALRVIGFYGSRGEGLFYAYGFGQQ